MIELNQVTKRYGQASVLKNITLTIDEPGIYCLLLSAALSLAGLVVLKRKTL